MKYGILCQLIAVFALAGSSPLSVAAEASGFDAGEVKKLRYLSRALLKSRAIEKERIERELQPQRRQLKEMRETLGVLDAEMLEAVSSSGVEPNETSSMGVGEMVVDGRIVARGETGKTRSVRPRQKATVQKQNAVNVAMKKLDASRGSIDRTIPRRWEFWKSKTPGDDRAEKMVSANLQVRQELSELVESDIVELKKIRALKGRLSLKKKDVPADDTHPTLQTITKHRR